MSAAMGPSSSRTAQMLRRRWLWAGLAEGLALAGVVAWGSAAAGPLASPLPSPSDPPGRAAPEDVTPSVGTETARPARPSDTAARRPPAPPVPPRPVIVHAVGDCALGDLHDVAGAPGSFAAVVAAASNRHDYPFSGVFDLFRHDDLTVANLEGTFAAPHRRRKKGGFAIRGVPGDAAMLVRGGVDIVDLANNHTQDYGPGGYDDTVAALDRAGVGYFGGAVIDRRTIRGVEVVNLGYLGGHPRVKQGMVNAVRREAGPRNIVIVSFHWGMEGSHVTHPLQRALGRAAVDAGADLVLGHHPHVVQGIERYRGRPIVYSLGNFVFGANSQPADRDAFIYRARFDITGSGEVGGVTGEVIPVSMTSDPRRNDFRPRLLQGVAADRVRKKIDALSARLRDPAT
ncbi:MAG: CapA family protein [Myxococcota bacterium]